MSESGPRPPSGGASGEPLGLRAAARRMMLYGLPLIETAQVRAAAFEKGMTANVFRHGRMLATPRNRTVTQPNNDTLYSSAWLDLSQGPVRITLPRTGSRYFSLALLDPFTNNFAVVGPRDTGGEGGEITVAGPASSSVGAAIRAPAEWVWALGRTLVDGPADLAAAHAVQDGLVAEGPPGRRPAACARRDAGWAEVLASLQALLVESPPPAADARLFAQTAALGLTPHGEFDPCRFDTAAVREIEAGLTDALVFATGAADAGVRRGGWSFPRPHLGDFGQDYEYRAQVALSGLAALPLEEAVYLRAIDEAGHDEIDSRRSWRLRFPPGGAPPVDGFWSLTIYEVTPQGQGFLIENPINRYSIGDRTPGLRWEADGSLEILISARDPGAGRRAHWLPAPANGRPMTLSLRAYLPRPDLADSYAPPQLTAD